jgi:tRNA pseudouridine32 synthase/23S rRNA pseudouridine746 synthase
VNEFEQCLLRVEPLDFELDFQRAEITSRYTTFCQLTQATYSLIRTRSLEQLCCRWMDDLAPSQSSKGKMLGVLLVETPNGLGLLKAFSGHTAPELVRLHACQGRLAEQLETTAWVPAIPLTHRPASEADTLIRLDELKAQAQMDAASTAFGDLERLEQFWKEKEAQLSAELQQGKQQRDRIRSQIGDDPIELERLNQLGAADGYRMRDFRKARKAALGELQAKVARLKQGMLEAKWERRKLSRQLQAELHQHFEDSLLPQFPGWMTQLFPQGARTGIGECCAPKLLYAANRLSLRPIAIAEFWWGPGTEGSLRENGTFYQACEERCQPLLGPLLSAWSPKLPIVYQDEAILVVDKPTCLLTVPGRLAEKQDSALLRLRRDFPSVLAVHRLDFETSGLVVFALSLGAQRELQRQFQARETKKRYLAVVEKPLLGAEEFRQISSPIASEPDEHHRYLLDAHGREAITLYRTISEERRRVELMPVTGRSHQLRVHLAYVLNNPIVGDPKYGSQDSSSRLCLHAASLQIRHPLDGRPLEFTAACPF